MSKIVYFVVAVDLDDKEIMFDTDTFEARFPDGGCWDDESGEWRAETEDEFEEARLLMREARDVWLA